MVEKNPLRRRVSTRERAEDVTRTVLADLGRRLTGDERVDIVACLPIEAAVRMVGVPPWAVVWPAIRLALMPCV